MASSQNPLSKIQSFKDLVRKLEDDLGWPLKDYGFDDLTFEYQPSELGLKENEAAKIKSIHQLRPLENGQPWGIFFIEFEKKKLPVVVLRRVLNHLVIKKRASANKADQKAWHAKDLLFISAYGNEGSSDRELAFAHFHEEQGDKPTLRVLDWDGSDTPLKLAHVEATLKSKLQWPRDTNNKEKWRKDWSEAFKHRPGYVIKKSNELAEALAALAKRICAATMTLMKAESEKGKLRKLYNAFKEALLHDLTEDGFADTYAQTITYGLLTAAISRTSGGLVADDLASMVPVTNPFLREMLETFLTAGGRRGGLDFDELGVQDVVDLLRGPDTDLPEILRDFGHKAAGEDPVIHFYEHFLSAYNKKLKIQRGVFYTPKPVVSYIVRSVHELLQMEFGLEDGLAATETWDDMRRKDPSIQLPLVSVVNSKTNQATTAPIDPFTPFVQILDPATGTGTFLVEVIDVIHKTMTAKWTKLRYNEAKQQELWNEYVPANLLPRLYGYELMMAPYAIAHMKLGLKLHETGYRFKSNERVRVYLTNALEPAHDFDGRLEFDVPALAHEAKAVNAVKVSSMFTVVVGNPPYAGISSNMSEFAQRIVDPYRRVDGAPLNERKLWLQDDYVKFIRNAQSTIELASKGIVALITNHSYLDNPTFRGMRQSLIKTFSSQTFIDLHGNTTKKEIAPDGSADKNVFEIKQGVAIWIALRSTKQQEIRHADVWGLQEQKYDWLRNRTLSSTTFESLSPHSPFYFFDPQDVNFKSEYDSAWRLPDIMPSNTTGFVTARDHFVIDFSKTELLSRITKFADKAVPDAKIRAMYFEGKGSSKYDAGDSRGWKLSTARKLIRADKGWDKRVTQCLYRPFDVRKIYWCDWMIDWPRPEVSRNLLSGKNLCLNVGRAGQVIDQGSWNIVFCSRSVTEFNLFRRGGNSLFPLWVEDGINAQSSFGEWSGKRLNIKSGFLSELASKLGVPCEGPLGLPHGIEAEYIPRYIYALLHAPSYRSRYASFLRVDFPRIPLTSSRGLFDQLVLLGGELMSLHLMDASLNLKTKYLGRHAPEIGKINFSSNTVWFDADQSEGVVGVDEAVWNFHIGGYQVCEKWLKDRKGRKLTKADIEHYQKIVAAIGETIRIMKEIDEVIDSHGGWPLK